MKNVSINLEKLRTIIKQQGVKQASICRLLNRNLAFMNDVWQRKTTFKPDELKIVADYLHTTPEYLTDQTDDPSIKKETAVSDDLAVRFAELFSRLSPEEQEREIAYLESKVAAQDN